MTFPSVDRLDVGVLTITRGCINRGNLIIEHAVREVLGLQDCAVEVDAHNPIDDSDLARLNACRIVVLPGATLLQAGHHPAADALHRISTPILALGAALQSRAGASDLRIARLVAPPLGSRDPFTHRAACDADLDSRLVGCPTLLLGSAEAWQTRAGPIVFSPGLGPQVALADCCRACADVGDVILLLHAPALQSAESLGITDDNIDVRELASARDALRLFARAAVVVTSRIHAALGALVSGTPVVFLGPWHDSRYTLVEHLGLPIEPPIPSRISRLVEDAVLGRGLSDSTYETVTVLRSALKAWIRDTVPSALRQPS